VRKEVAGNLYREGLTQQQISERLGFSQHIISEDLKDLETLSVTDKVSRVDRLGRKNTGRPKGSSKPKRKFSPTVEDRVATLILDEGKTKQEASALTGVSDTVVRHAVAREEGRREAHADPIIDPATLSRTAQEKLASAVRQHQQRLDMQWQFKFAQEIRQQIEDVIMPKYRQLREDADKIINRHKGIMPRAHYRLLLSCLHPDSRHSASDAKLAEALNILKKHEVVLCEKDPDKPKGPPLPTTWAEWEAARQEGAAARSKRAKEAAAKRTVKRY
jgi:transposase